MLLSWEVSSNPAYHGFLKCLNFQKDGIDLHATFVTSNDPPHISVYNGDKKVLHVQMKKAVWGKGIKVDPADLAKIVAAVGEFDDEEWATFVSRVEKKYASLTASNTEKAPAPAASFGSALGETKATWGGGKKDIRDTMSFPSLNGKK